MEKFTLLLFIKSVVLFVAIVITISMIDGMIENIIYSNKLSFDEFVTEKNSKGFVHIPVASALIALIFWWFFYILSNL